MAPRGGASSSSDILLYLVSIFFPPLPVLLKRGCGCDLLLNIILDCLGWLPGIVHAWYIIYSTPGRKGYDNRRPAHDNHHRDTSRHSHRSHHSQPHRRSAQEVRYVQQPPVQQYYTQPMAPANVAPEYGRTRY